MARVYVSRPAEERFWEKIEDPSDPEECWEWTAHIGPDGYGRLHVKHEGRNIKALAHRFAYELLVGEIPEGMEIDHLCRNRRCVNPAHLEPVTRQENVLRGESFASARARQTHCKRGHSLHDAYLNKRGNRTCRPCMLDYMRRQAIRKRAS